VFAEQRSSHPILVIVIATGLALTMNCQINRIVVRSELIVTSALDDWRPAERDYLRQMRASIAE
jgi:hypothetical protein